MSDHEVRPEPTGDMTGVARDASTLTEVLAAFDAAGYRGHFATRVGGHVECLTCHVQAPANAVGMDALRRLEGASDPADMLVVAALSCGSCGAHGALVLNYGPEATEDDDDVFVLLDPPPAPDAGSGGRAT